MKYFALVEDTEYQIVIDGEQILVDGEDVTVDLIQGGAPELYSMLFNGASYEILIEAERQEYAVMLRGEQYSVNVEDEFTRRLNVGRKTPASQSGEMTITAPIPGLVVKVLVEEGQGVEEDQPLIILEAMKMENEIRSLRSGVIKSVTAAAGQRVEQGAPLLAME